MTAPTRRSAARWPSSAADKEDHYRALDLVARVGWARLHFTVRDLAEAMDEPGVLRLARPAELARHVALLPPSVLRRVDWRYRSILAARADSGAAAANEKGESGSGSTDAAAARGTAGVPRGERGDDGRPIYYYVIAERYEEHRRAPRPPDEYERAYYALCVAVATLGVDAVPTRAVTDVTENVVDLGLRADRQTALLLTQLLERRTPLVERLPPADGARWVRWRPAAGLPDGDPRLDAWVEEYRRARGATSDVHAAGTATLSELARRLVAHAVERTRSRDWPAGRSVTIAEIEAAAQDDQATDALLRLVRERGGTLGRVLGDATKRRMAGAERVQQRIVRLPGPVGSRAYYDLPDVDGFARRRLVVPVQALRGELTSSRVRELLDERAAAERLGGASTSAALRAIGAARAALVHQAIAELGQHVEQLVAAAALLSKAKRTELEAFVARLADCRERAGSAGDATAAAAGALAAVGLDWDAVRDAPRPLLTGDELAAWMTDDERRGRTGSTVIANYTTLRRYPNPAHDQRSRSDASRAAVYCVDRVDALTQLADRSGGRAGAWLAQGARLLGPHLRDARLVHRLLAEAQARGAVRDWAAALAALVLLGDPAAAAIADRTLADGASCPAHAECALYALLALRQFVSERVPPSVRFSRDPRLRAVAQRVTAAARRGQWLGG